MDSKQFLFERTRFCRSRTVVDIRGTLSVNTVKSQNERPLLFFKFMRQEDPRNALEDSAEYAYNWD